MIIMDLKLHNIYAFKNFHANFSYPKKIVRSNIENEHLKDYPNFRYKKVNILMGTNATGKTTLGKALISIFNFIQRNNPTLLIDAIQSKQEDAKVIIDFVEEDIDGLQKLFRVQLLAKADDSDSTICAAMHSVKIGKKDNYETCATKLDSLEYSFTKDTVSLFDSISQLGWYFSDTDSNTIDVKNNSKNKVFINILNKVMTSFDNFIVDVTPIEDDSDSILIKFHDGNSVIYHNGEVLGPKNILSKGTESSIVISEIITNVLLRRNGFYYCDEKFCYVQSDLEKAILLVLIESLGYDQQLFFTSHNTDILDLDLPKHAFSFLRKEVNDQENPIKMISASDYLKKQQDSLRNAVENDLFSLAPDDSKIYSILELPVGI